MPDEGYGCGVTARGVFKSVPGHISGIKVYGEQREAAVSDFNRDRRVDLAVSQNGAETRLFLNQTARQGVRIKLVGPAVNKVGIGSRFRLVYEDGTKGPSRSVQSGSGYWSQNSVVQVLGYDKSPKAIEVAWFDGTQQKVQFVEGKWNYVIPHPEN